MSQVSRYPSIHNSVYDGGEGLYVVTCALEREVILNVFFFKLNAGGSL